MVEDSNWTLGLNSLTDPSSLRQGEYQWSTNTLNKGGVIRTRPGLRAMRDQIGQRLARGAVAFTPQNQTHPILVTANNHYIRYLEFPYAAGTFKTVTIDDDPLLINGDGIVSMEIAVVGVTEDADGNLTAIEPYPVLLISDGVGKTVYWDGVNAGYHSDLICSHMKFIGNRLWTMQGKKIRVSNLLNPLSFSEEDVLAEGGYFVLPDNGMGFGVTPDFRSLLAFTDFTTTAFQAGILNRAAWQTTPDFQKVIFSNIGCAAPNTIINQFGLTWWWSHNGLTSLDSALQTYRSSKINFKDRNMSRSLANLSDDLSGACAGVFGNYLLLSVPSGDLHNYYTWVMDESVVETLGSEFPPVWASAWTGIRPVKWITTNIDGKARCFAYSNDTAPAGSTLGQLFVNLWEAFLPDSRDIGYDSSFTVKSKNIPCSLELKFMGESDDYKRFGSAEVDVGEITDKVNVQIYYAGKRGMYKQICDKDIVASRDSVTVHNTETIPIRFEQWLPERRLVKSVNETILAADLNPKVEKPFNRDKDKAFSLLITWTGKMAVQKVRMYLEEDTELKEGQPEAAEVKERYVRVGGESSIGTKTHVGLTFDILPDSGYINPVTPRYFEEQYNSLT